ncbi:hypothetical protein [Arcticibacter sp.]|uniref:hypothetical protein n=1 Tax=Arcticibacter sp. TaxID=1872630 RepID=UPI00388D854E
MRKRTKTVQKHQERTYNGGKIFKINGLRENYNWNDNPIKTNRRMSISYDGLP